MRNAAIHVVGVRRCCGLDYLTKCSKISNNPGYSVVSTNGKKMTIETARRCAAMNASELEVIEVIIFDNNTPKEPLEIFKPQTALAL